MHGRIPDEQPEQPAKPPSYSKTTRGRTTITIEPSPVPVVIEVEPKFGKGKRYRVKVIGAKQSRIDSGSQAQK